MDIIRSLLILIDTAKVNVLIDVTEGNFSYKNCKERKCLNMGAR